MTLRVLGGSSAPSRIFSSRISLLEAKFPVGREGVSMSSAGKLAFACHKGTDFSYQGHKAMKTTLIPLIEASLRALRQLSVSGFTPARTVESQLRWCWLRLNGL